MTEQTGPRLRPLLASGVVLAALVAVAVLAAVLSVIGLSAALIAALLIALLLVLCAVGARLRLPGGGVSGGVLPAVEALSAFGLFAIVGGFFGAGGDGIAVVIGLALAFVIVLLLLEPRRALVRARSLPDYLSLRYRSEAVRYLTLAVAAIATLLLVAAQLVAGGWIAGQVIGITPVAGIVIVTLAILLLRFRSAGKAMGDGTGAVALVAVFGLGIVTVWLLTQATGIVVPQVAYGGLMQDIRAGEALLGLAGQPAMAFDDGVRIFAGALGLGVGGAVLLHLSGPARSADHRRGDALRSGVLWLAAVATALPALGVLAKADLIARFVAMRGEAVPDVFRPDPLSGESGLSLEALSSVDLQFVPMAVPVLAEASGWLTALFALSLVALLAIAGAGLLRMMAALSVSRLVVADAEQRSRWLTIVIMAIAACIALTGANILTLGALAHALVGGSVFAPLALGLWWPRATGAGALAGIVGGALVVAVSVFWGSTGIDLLSAGAIGLVVSLVLTILVSLLSDPASSVPADTQRRIGLTKDPEAPE